MLPLRRPCKAVNPAQATEPACSNVTLGGLITNPRSRAHAYSAREGRATPKTSSPALNSVTFLATASTSPATSLPPGPAPAHPPKEKDEPRQRLRRPL